MRPDFCLGHASGIHGEFQVIGIALAGGLLRSNEGGSVHIAVKRGGECLVAVVVAFLCASQVGGQLSRHILFKLAGVGDSHRPGVHFAVSLLNSHAQTIGADKVALTVSVFFGGDGVQVGLVFRLRGALDAFGVALLITRLCSRCDWRGSCTAGLQLGGQCLAN